MRKSPFQAQLDWSSYQDAGMGDAYADIPKHGGDFTRAVAVCINNRKCETEFKGVMCPPCRTLQDTHYSTGGTRAPVKGRPERRIGECPIPGFGTDPKHAAGSPL